MLSHEHRDLTVSRHTPLPFPSELNGVSGLRAITDRIVNGRLASFYYSADGKTAREQVWKETMKELSFARIEDIIASMI